MADLRELINRWRRIAAAHAKRQGEYARGIARANEDCAIELERAHIVPTDTGERPIDSLEALADLLMECRA